MLIVTRHASRNVAPKRPITPELVLTRGIVHDRDRRRREHHDAPTRPRPPTSLETPVRMPDECVVIEAGALVSPDAAVPPLGPSAGGERQPRQQDQRGQRKDLAFAEAHFHDLLAL